VGNTYDRLTCLQIPLVHPHTRGEYNYCKHNTKPVTGSPPHAWGVRDVFFPQKIDYSGSPPHAWGVPVRFCKLSCLQSVHPHTRGEYVL